MDGIWLGGEERHFAPVWWDHKGLKMRIAHANSMLVRISDAAASIEISPQHNRGYPWIVRRKLDVFIAGETSGHIEMSTSELQACFGLSERFTPLPQLDNIVELMKQEYDCTVVCPGKFIRAGRYLSIPDPPPVPKAPNHNVSLYLEDSIVAIVRELIEKREAPIHY